MSMSFFSPDKMAVFTAQLYSTYDIPGIDLPSVRDMLRRPEVQRQLYLTQITNPSKQTPQAGSSENAELNFEVRRRIKTLILFELLLNGDYVTFTAGQKKPLSCDAFQQLRQEASALSHDELAVIRASCFLIISDEAKKKLKTVIGRTIEDSEEYLTELAGVLLTLSEEKRNELAPLILSLTESQLKLLSHCYLKNCHLRHMMFTEGGENMFKGLERTNPSVIKLWKWRWLCNLFGFNGNSAYYDQDVHDIVTCVFDGITQMEKSGMPLNGYLHWRAARAGFSQRSDIDGNEKLFLGHLAAFGNKITILDAEAGQEILRGYLYFRNQLHGGVTPAVDYVQHFIPNVQETPTYVPALLNAVYDILSNTKDQEFQQLQQQTLSSFDGKKLSPLSLATIYCCQVLAAIYRRDVSYSERISCQKSASKAALLESLQGWLKNDFLLSVRVDEKHEVVVSVTPRSEHQLTPH